MGSDRRAKFLQCMVIVGGDRRDLSVRNRDLWVERGEIQVLLMLFWAIMAARTSVITSKPANGDQVKTGQREGPGQNCFTPPNPSAAS